MKRIRPQTGINIHVKDLSEYSKLIFDKCSKTVPNLESVSVQTLGCVRKGYELSVMNVDGVGGDYKFNEPMTISFTLLIRIEGGTSYRQSDEAEITITAADFEKLPDLRVEPLETFIRTFGRRLENNFDLWHRELRSQKTPV